MPKRPLGPQGAATLCGGRTCSRLGRRRPGVLNCLLPIYLSNPYPREIKLEHCDQFPNSDFSPFDTFILFASDPTEGCVWRLSRPSRAGFVRVPTLSASQMFPKVGAQSLRPATPRPWAGARLLPFSPARDCSPKLYPSVQPEEAGGKTRGESGNPALFHSSRSLAGSPVTPAPPDPEPGRGERRWPSHPAFPPALPGRAPGSFCSSAHIRTLTGGAPSSGVG